MDATVTSVISSVLVQSASLPICRFDYRPQHQNQASHRRTPPSHRRATQSRPWPHHSPASPLDTIGSHTAPNPKPCPCSTGRSTPLPKWYQVPLGAASMVIWTTHTGDPACHVVPNTTRLFGPQKSLIDCLLIENCILYFSNVFVLYSQCCLRNHLACGIILAFLLSLFLQLDI
jgi:hypothetical protein